MKMDLGDFLEEEEGKKMDLFGIGQGRGGEGEGGAGDWSPHRQPGGEDQNGAD